MSYENLLVEQDNHLAKVVVNRPKVMNALNDDTFSELLLAFEALKEDRSVRGVIVTGAGEKAFVAGADITELKDMDGPEAKRISEKGQNVFNLVENLGKPVCAAINGFALGGGLEFAMACSFRYASENAKMGQPEINLGLVPGYAGTQRLPRLIGKGKALELLFSGNMIDAQEAYRLGLVNGVTAADQLIPTVEKVMKAIVSKSPVINGFICKAVNHGMEMSLIEGQALETEFFSKCTETKDMREGTKAFLEKRKPEFKGE